MPLSFYSRPFTFLTDSPVALSWKLHSLGLLGLDSGSENVTNRIPDPRIMLSICFEDVGHSSSPNIGASSPTRSHKSYGLYISCLAIAGSAEGTNTILDPLKDMPHWSDRQDGDISPQKLMHHLLISLSWIVNKCQEVKHNDTTVQTFSPKIQQTNVWG